MQQALKSSWTDELSDQLKHLSVPPVRKTAQSVFGSALAENVVRPTFQRDRFASASPNPKPELTGALDAVMRAADLIRAAQDRAAQVEEEMSALADRTADQLRTAEQQLQALQDRARSAEEKLAAVTERAAEKLADADAQIQAARDDASRESERADTIEQRSREQLAQAQMLIKDANERVFAADTRALEAKEDLTYLENYIRERFAL